VGGFVSLILVYGLVDFTSVDGDSFRSGDAQADLTSVDINDCNFNVITDNNRFAFSPAKNQHGKLLFWSAMPPKNPASESNNKKTLSKSRK
jgi:hypothetical protein